jgi:Thioredoxin like C-terminal domain
MKGVARPTPPETLAADEARECAWLARRRLLQHGMRVSRAPYLVRALVVPCGRVADRYSGARIWAEASARAQDRLLAGSSGCRHGQCPASGEMLGPGRSRCRSRFGCAAGISIAPATRPRPETYLGNVRSERFGSPDRLPFNHWALAGEWTIGRESVVLDEAGGRIAYRFHARDTHLVLSRGAGGPIPFRVLFDGEAPGPSHGVDVDEGGTACSGTAACASSYASTTRSASGRWRSRSSSQAPRRTRSRSARPWASPPSVSPPTPAPGC